jgi:hypothetical protein
VSAESEKMRVMRLQALDDERDALADADAHRRSA